MTDDPTPILTEAIAGAAGPCLWLCVEPEEREALLRQPELRAGRPRGRAARVSVVWHDTPDAALAADGLALGCRHGAGAAPVWELQRLVADRSELWPPGGAPRVLAEAAAPGLIGQANLARLAAQLRPVAAFEGSTRVLADTPALQASLLEGGLRAVTAVRPVCRLVLCGPGAAAAAIALAERLRLTVAERSLAAEALQLVGRLAVTRPLGAPALAARLDVDGGFAFVVAHLAGVLLHHVPAAIAADGPEPVHQMRVAVRRLRSAMLLFRRAVACPELEAVTQGLKALGHVLGPARDWDVFVLGTGAKVGASFTGDAAVQGLLAAAERRRQQSYAALRRYLAGPGFRVLGIRLAALALWRPWRDAVPEDAAETEKRAALQRAGLAAYAARALSRRLAPVVAPGADLSGLTPEALHQIRLHTKRLRYATEFFSPLFPGRDTNRFLRRMAAVQERLGQLNDATVAAGLMAELPRGGAARAYATGVLRGFVAARTAGGRRKLEKTWQRFFRLEPFWH